MKKLHFDPPETWLAPPPVWDPSTPLGPELLPPGRQDRAAQPHLRTGLCGVFSQVRAEAAVAVGVGSAVALLVTLAGGDRDAAGAAVVARAIQPPSLSQAQGKATRPARSDLGPMPVARPALAGLLPRSGAVTTPTAGSSKAVVTGHVVVKQVRRPAGAPAGSGNAGPRKVVTPTRPATAALPKPQAPDRPSATARRPAGGQSAGPKAKPAPSADRKAKRHQAKQQQAKHRLPKHQAEPSVRPGKNKQRGH